MFESAVVGAFGDGNGVRVRVHETNGDNLGVLDGDGGVEPRVDIKFVHDLQGAVDNGIFTKALLRRMSGFNMVDRPWRKNLIVCKKEGRLRGFKMIRLRQLAIKRNVFALNRQTILRMKLIDIMLF